MAEQYIALSERLQLDPSLTLEKARTTIRQKEAIHEQQDFLKGDSKTNPITLDAVIKATRRSHSTPQHSVEKVTKPGQLRNSAVADVVEVPTGMTSACPTVFKLDTGAEVTTVSD